MNRFTSGEIGTSDNYNLVGMNSWARAKEAGFNKKQIKRAVQQLRDNTSMEVGERLAKHIKDFSGPGGFGIKHEDDPLGKYQGPQGHLGIKAYQQARGEFSASKIRELIGDSGMTIPGDVTAYQRDLEIEDRRKTDAAKLDTFNKDNDALRDQIDNMMSMYSQPNNTISKSTPYSVGTGGNTSLKAAPTKSKRSSVRKTWGRGGAGFKSSLNSGAATGKPSPSLNV